MTGVGRSGGLRRVRRRWGEVVAAKGTPGSWTTEDALGQEQEEEAQEEETQEEKEETQESSTRPP